MFVSDILLEYTLLNPKIVCRSNMSGHQVQNVSRADLLIVVTSSPENFERRKLIFATPQCQEIITRVGEKSFQMNFQFVLFASTADKFPEI